MRILVDGSIRHDHGALRALVGEGFADVDSSGVEVRLERAVRGAQSFCGRAYAEPPSRPRAGPGTRYLIRLFLPATLRNRGYPKTYRYVRRKTAPWITVEDWRERLVALAAHEAFHVHQFRGGLRRSEVQAERWAAQVLGRWRAEPLGREPPPEPLEPLGQLAFDLSSTIP